MTLTAFRFICLVAAGASVCSAKAQFLTHGVMPKVVTVSESHLKDIESAYVRLCNFKLNRHQKDLSNYAISIWNQDGNSIVFFEPDWDVSEGIVLDDPVLKNGMVLAVNVSRADHKVMASEPSFHMLPIYSPLTVAILRGSRLQDIEAAYRQLSSLSPRPSSGEISNYQITAWAKGDNTLVLFAPSAGADRGEQTQAGVTKKDVGRILFEVSSKRHRVRRHWTPTADEIPPIG